MFSQDNRFYEKEFPEPGELVVVKVLRLENNMGAYVSLLEYGRMEGLILPSELSKRRFRSINKLIRVGRQEVVMVVRVDTEKGYVDLSKKRVAPEDIASTEEKFSRSKKVYLTARQAATQLDVPVEEINRKAVWPLYRKYGHAYDGLKEAVENPDQAFEGTDCPEEIVEALVKDMKLRLAPQAVKLRARIQLSCTGAEGVLGVKESLIAAVRKFENENKQQFELKIKLIAAPLYYIVATALDKTEGLRKVNQALDIVKTKILSYQGGEFQQQGEIMAFGVEDQLDLNADGEEDESSESDSSSGSESGSESGSGSSEDESSGAEVSSGAEDKGKR